MENNFDYEIFNIVRGTFSPEVLLLSLSDDTINTDTRALDTKNSIIYSHEHFHYLQTSMTGFGQTYWNMVRQGMSCIFTEWLVSTEKYKAKRPLPIGYLATKSNADLVNAFKLNIYRYTLNILYLQNYKHPSISSFRDIIDMPFNNSYSLTPQINHGGKTFDLNGRDIIESHAKYLEAIYANIIHNVPINVTLDINKLPYQYYIPYLWFVNEVGIDKEKEFPIICDLSLQTGKLKISLDEQDWKAIHPGWRFYNLTQALKIITTPSMSSLEEIKNNYTEYCNVLLKHCKFTSLEETFSEILTFYDNRCENCDGLKQEERMKKAFLYRVKHPWSAANPFIDLDTWVEMKNLFPPPSYIINNSYNVTIIEPEDIPKNPTHADGITLEHVAELHLQALSMQILGVVSKYSLDIDEIQCGFAYFGIKNGCRYQSEGKCSGSLNPKEEYKIGYELINENLDFIGCTFAVCLAIHECSISDIDLNFRFRKMPSFDEMKTRLEGTDS
ncbi:MAG TPA: hypothetical protein VIR55_07755 [Ignavibacteria bacterium]